MSSLALSLESLDQPREQWPACPAWSIVQWGYTGTCFMRIAIAHNGNPRQPISTGVFNQLHWVFEHHSFGYELDKLRWIARILSRMACLETYFQLEILKTSKNDMFIAWPRNTLAAYVQTDNSYTYDCYGRHSWIWIHVTHWFTHTHTLVHMYLQCLYIYILPYTKTSIM